MSHCAKYRVRGRVQGVSYRQWTLRQAQALGLTGWVRNLDDGSVEVLACGAMEGVTALHARLWQGPSHAVVSEVATLPAEEPAPATFEVRR